MKKYLRLFLYNGFSLWLTASLIPGVNFLGKYQVVALTALVLTLVNVLVRPLVNLLFLPINLLTLGSFRWLINVIALYLVTKLVSQFQIGGFQFLGFNYRGLIVPAFFISTFWVYVLASFGISLITSFLLWLSK
jgi:putative membrane protein